MVVRPFFTQARRVRQALEMLYQRQAKYVAIVFNQARPDDMAAQQIYCTGTATDASQRPRRFPDHKLSIAFV